MAFYQAKLDDHFPTTSSKKGTPGIHFSGTILAEKRGEEFVPVTPRNVSFQMWFSSTSKKQRDFNLKKLAHAGFQGGGLAGLNLAGKLVELSSHTESYNGSDSEKFELALPPGEGGGGGNYERDDQAGLAIDALFASEGAGGSVSSGFDDTPPPAAGGYDPGNGPGEDVPF